MTDYEEGSARPSGAGLGLALGILVFPYVFAWFTLRRGYGVFTRVAAFTWMAWTVGFMAYALMLAPKTPVAATANTAVAAKPGGDDGAALAAGALGVAGGVALASHRYSGHDYCWYNSGWHGAGFYRCSFAWRHGYGWGGPLGWHGWSNKTVAAAPVQQHGVSARRARFGSRKAVEEAGSISSKSSHFRSAPSSSFSSSYSSHSEHSSFGGLFHKRH